MKWLVVLNFVIAAHAQQINVSCDNRACVESMIQRAFQSPTLARLRAFGPENHPTIPPESNRSIFPADIDIVFN